MVKANKSSPISITQDFIDFYKEMGNLIGVDDLTASIFASLYIEPEEITLEDLSRKTGYSLGSISNKIKLLSNLGLVRKRTKPGTKRLYLYVEKDFCKILKQQLIRKQEYEINFAKSKLPELIAKHEQKAKTDTEKKKLALLKSYHKQIIQMDVLLNLMIRKLSDIKECE